MADENDISTDTGRGGSDDRAYHRIRAAVYSSPWAILPEKLEEICAVLELRAQGIRISEEEIKEIAGAARAKSEPVPQKQNTAIAVVSVTGTITQRVMNTASGPGGTSTDRLGATLEKLVSDPSVSAIVLDVNSPGGSVYGVAELSQRIFEMRSEKKIVAVANSLMASAAYWIASAAEEISAPVGAQIGSIGVIAMHEDVSKRLEQLGVKTTIITAGKFKGEGNPYEPLGADARANMQATVDDYYSMFTEAVARNRDATPAEVKSGFGQGRVLRAQGAQGARLIDRVETLGQVLQRLSAEVGATHAIGATGHGVKLLEKEIEILEK